MAECSPNPGPNSGPTDHAPTKLLPLPEPRPIIVYKANQNKDLFLRVRLAEKRFERVK
jgi:hypothetical protein